jgi:predicted dehydrogenase
MMQRVLVIGYGSIGVRHARLLNELGCHVAIVSRREVDFPLAYFGLAEAIAAEHPDYVVIANETSQHRQTLSALAQLGYTGTVLVEKPLFSNWKDFSLLPFRKIFVAYNLRFHPVIKRLRSLLEGEQILSVQAYVGQYLPDWRPGSDYRTSYSASAKQGGGVIRDLSHELDYLIWLLGSWERVSALGGHLSALEIDSDDVFALMLVTQKCPVVTLQLNYLDRLSRRNVLINTTELTIEADLIKGTITIDRASESISVGRDETYRAMHQAVLSDSTADLCSLNEGLETLRLIEAAERAVKQEEWVKR